jgi:hypothetical protein
MHNSTKKLLWVVVEVRSGIPVSVDVFLDQQSAKDREQLLRARMNPDNDEVGVFCVEPPV